ncbi:hypothetical protein F441_18034 [Phytophthora nicotianae CJ01A1]|uniref:Uncharacterized protein n=2 Tax=Phytophthora nicotianae TaxID=4792 RepID=W2I4U8_PHYNI|nr:hypothetical protein L915_17688 [Phytophthora nicotianae]ETL29186.1 hypothetical protein L916_17577 [Phytophthora nicotianae]ETP05345.1 hypothetical protein F441_18034 [Phytophthora nicotianae CJ01A1]
MGSLLRQLMACCTHESTTSRSFAVGPAPSVTLVRRASAMRKAGMLLELQCRHNSIAFLLSNAQEGGSDSAIDVVRVFSRQVPRVFDPEAKRSRKALPVTAQIGEQTVRMEIEGMPEGGWPVNTPSWTGPCRYWMKFAACIHTLLAKHVCGVHAMGKRERLVYRGPHKRQGAYVGGLPGRPCFNAPALQIE